MKPLLNFEGMPAPANWRALRTLRRKPSPGVELPVLAAEARKVRIDEPHLRRYRRICGYAETAGVPLPYPQVTAVGLQMQLLTQPEFPLPLLGLVHLGNRIEQTRPLDPAGSYTVTVSVEQGQRTERGIEFAIVTRWRAREEVWNSTARVLSRVPNRSARRRPPSEPVSGALGDYLMFEAPSDIGRRYGRIAGDMNPIHLYPITARAFGFPRHIAHGMWSLARCAALLEPVLGWAPRALEAGFRQPLLLPGKVALRFRKDDSAVEFALLNRGSGKVHLAGQLR